MEKKCNISQYRARLDKTLTSHDLANEEIRKTLVKNQILRTSQDEIEVAGFIDSVVERRTKEVSNFLDMLKSASVDNGEGLKISKAPHAGWKLKQDTEEYRVMYREGPEGTPFHTLLVEGYVDGPVDVCLCISWESVLYKKWWPQFIIPSFKVLSSHCLQKIRIGEQISLVRMKVPWPLSEREAIVQYFEFEYFQDDLIIVLLNSISDLESIDRRTHGFTKDGIPAAQDVVRIDLEGGFAIQKVTPERSYFRTIANMDIKLDFVPPSFINFISRQLIGRGFKLYQKEVVSARKGDEDFGEALKDPLYTRIHEALYENKRREDIEVENIDNKKKEDIEVENIDSGSCFLHEEQLIKNMQTDGHMDGNVVSDGHASESSLNDAVINVRRTPGEIEEIGEEGSEEIRRLEEDGKDTCTPLSSQISAEYYANNNREIVIRPEVEQALETLEKVISIFREYGFNPKTKSSYNNKEFLNLETSNKKDSKSSKDSKICSNNGVCVEVSKSVVVERPSYEPRSSSGSHSSRCTGSNSFSREANHNRIAPAEDLLCPNETHQTALISTENEKTETSILDTTTNGNKLVDRLDIDVNGDDELGPKKEKSKRRRLCCFHVISGLLMA